MAEGGTLEGIVTNIKAKEGKFGPYLGVTIKTTTGPAWFAGKISGTETGEALVVTYKGSRMGTPRTFRGKRYPAMRFLQGAKVTHRDGKAQVAPKAAPAGPTKHAPAIVALFDAAAGHKLKWPKITLKTRQGRTIQFARCGPKAASPGAVNVTDGGRYGSNVWYGRIHTDGKIQEAAAMIPEIMRAIEVFNADPIEVTAKAGKLSGRCVYCLKKLTTDESLEAGYGPICADHWGLPWGNRAPKAARQARADARRAVQEDAREIARRAEIDRKTAELAAAKAAQDAFDSETLEDLAGQGA